MASRTLLSARTDRSGVTRDARPARMRRVERGGDHHRSATEKGQTCERETDAGVSRVAVAGTWGATGGAGRVADRRTDEFRPGQGASPLLSSLLSRNAYSNIPHQKIWDSGLALSAWLHARLPQSSSINNALTKSYLHRLLPGSGNVRIVELGAGTGLVSFALGAALRRQEGSVAGVKRYDIYATDLGTCVSVSNGLGR